MMKRQSGECSATIVERPAEEGKRIRVLTELCVKRLARRGIPLATVQRCGALSTVNPGLALGLAIKLYMKFVAGPPPSLTS